MAFVLDASIAAAWALADEASPIADIAAEHLKIEPAIAPHLLWYEIRNILIVSERRRRITVAESAIFLDLLEAHSIQIESVEDEKTILGLARQYQISFYDAAYLALAVFKQAPLATLNKPLRAAAKAAGVTLLA